MGEAYGSFLSWDKLQPWVEGTMIDTVVEAEWEKMTVAEIDDTLVGVVTVEDEKIGLLWTHPDFRRRKVGSVLMDKADSIMRGKGISTARLECFSDNARGLAFYRSIGWVTVRREMNEDVEVMQDVMEKTL